MEEKMDGWMNGIVVLRPERTKFYLEVTNDGLACIVVRCERGRFCRKSTRYIDIGVSPAQPYA